MINSTLLNRYTIKAELGKGGMGIVYKANDSLLDRLVAIKFLNASGMGTTGKARLLQEARAVAKLNHPNIVSVFDAGEEDGNPFIVMELVEGKTLRHVTMSTVAEAFNATLDICKALDHAHARGIIHRDLKLENVILTDSQTVKLMDFGLARASEQDRLTEEGMIIGTFNYLAPELIEGRAASPQSDLYALGVIMYELLTGRSPFQGTINEIIGQHLHGIVKPPSQYNPNVPVWADNLVLDLLSKRPEERPASVRDVISVLEKQVLEPAPTFQYKIFPKTRNNLPAQLSSFIGRKQELAQIKDLIASSRLVTLTGVGGTGKTRLALQTAEELLDTFKDGVWFVELAPVTDANLIPNTIAAVLQLQETQNRTIMELVIDFLADRDILLVLDNCEHLIQACAELTNIILQRCEKIKILITSREPVGISGERIWSVPSLSLPKVSDFGNAEIIEKTEAVKLFLERTQAALPDFALTAENAGFVAQICTRLDGIPLALELAAARVRSMNVEQIASRLDQRFRLLTGGSRAALPRQQTLSALVDWSYNLLTEDERVVFQRLAIFIGPFTLEAAEHICADETIHKFDVLDLIQRIMDKSLLVMEERYGETYYRMLETIRQYGRDKLISSNEAEHLEDLNAGYFETFSKSVYYESHKRDQIKWFRRISVMQDNLRAALNWTIETNQTERALTLTRNLAWAWFRRSEFQESHQWLERAIKMPGAKELKSLYIEVLIFFARGTWLELGSEKAAPIIEEALKEAHNIEDKTNLAWALSVRSLIFTTAGHIDQSLAAGLKAKSIFEDLENQYGYAHAILSIALCASYQKNHKEALVHYQDAYNLFAMHEDIFFQNVAQRWIGVHEIALNNFEIGLSALQKALRAAQVMESTNEIALAVWEFAKSARVMGNYPRAVRLSMAFKTIQSNLGTWTQADEAGLEKILQVYQEQMDAASFEVAREQGLALTLDQTIEYALQV